MVQEPHSGTTQTLPRPQDSIMSTSQRGLVAPSWALQSGSLGQEQGRKPATFCLSHLHQPPPFWSQASTAGRDSLRYEWTL